MNIFEKIVAGLGIFIVFLVILLIVGLLISFPVMWLWNGCLVGLVAGVSPITSVWQSLGIIVLFSLLFKSGYSSLNSKK